MESTKECEHPASRAAGDVTEKPLEACVAGESMETDRGENGDDEVDSEMIGPEAVSATTAADAVEEEEEEEEEEDKAVVARVRGERGNAMLGAWMVRGDEAEMRVAEEVVVDAGNNEDEDAEGMLDDEVVVEGEQQEDACEGAVMDGAAAAAARAAGEGTDILKSN